MKKIKKLLTIGLAFLLTLCMGVSFISCSMPERELVFDSEYVFDRITFIKHMNTTFSDIDEFVPPTAIGGNAIDTLPEFEQYLRDNLNEYSFITTDKDGERTRIFLKPISSVVVTKGNPYVADAYTFLLQNDGEAYKYIATKSEDEYKLDGLPQYQFFFIQGEGLGYRIQMNEKFSVQYHYKQQADVKIDKFPSAIQEDFTFSLSWGTYGISSYNSRTGELIKAKDAPNLAEYTAEYYLSEADLERIYAAIRDLDMFSYPDAFDPEPNMGVDPPMQLSLRVTNGGLEKTITAKEVVSFGANGYEKGDKFLRVCKTIVDILTETEQWKSLPDYPYLYD